MAVQGLVRCLVLAQHRAGAPQWWRAHRAIGVHRRPRTGPEALGRQARQQLQALAPIGSAVELRSTATDRYSRLETGQRYRCSEIGSHAIAQQLLAQGHRTLDGDGDGEACESLGGSSS